MKKCAICRELGSFTDPTKEGRTIHICKAKLPCWADCKLGFGIQELHPASLDRPNACEAFRRKYWFHRIVAWFKHK